MRVIDRERVQEAEKVYRLEDILKVKEEWWRPGDCIETFPKGYVPCFLLNEASLAKNVEDEQLVLMPKSGSWVEYPVKDCYVLCKVEELDSVIKRYADSLPSGWFAITWNCNLK